MKFLYKTILLFTLLLLLLLAACTGAGVEENGDSITTATGFTATGETSYGLSEEEQSLVVGYDLSFSDRDYESDYKEITATITLQETTASVSGDNVYQDGDVLYIMAGGTYVLEGVWDGQVVVQAAGEKVHLVLNNVELECEDNAALYIRQADKVFLTLAENTQNRIASGETLSDEAVAEDISAALYSKDDLTINGGGTLYVSGGFQHGIVSKDTLTITGGTLNIEAVGDGLRGRDCVKIAGGRFSITAGSDAIQSGNDSGAEGVGFVYICGGTFDLTGGCDGIQAETLLLITEGEFSIQTGGGSENASFDQSGNEVQGGGNWGASTDDSDDSTAKGLKAETALIIAGGEFSLDTFDDSVHCNGDCVISGGDLLLSSGDDGIHADGALHVSGGTLTLTQSYEGLEAANITIDDGWISVVSSDDGLNAAGGDGSTFNRAGANGFSNNSEYFLVINGGTLLVQAYGDGLDSNGTLTINGGTVLISGPEENNNGAIDSGESVSPIINGGLVVAAGSYGMAESFGEDSSQCSLNYVADSVQTAGTRFSLLDNNGQVLVSYTPLHAFQSVVVSAPSMTLNATLTVALGGTITETAEDEDGLSLTGSLNNPTLSEGITLDSIASGSTTGGMGGGGNMDGFPNNRDSTMQTPSGSGQPSDTGRPQGGGRYGDPPSGTSGEQSESSQ